MDTQTAQNLISLRITITGAVQGAGFRPFIYRLAAEHHLCGWVINNSQGVIIEAEGEEVRLKAFIREIKENPPPHVLIQSLEFSSIPIKHFTCFEIRESQDKGKKSALVLPDIATCPLCLAELFDPSNRRYLYPFINCTHCGPRFSIIENLPYDRPNTTMKSFIQCPDCEQEYRDPSNRRFHAQPNACPVCGPHVELWDHQGNILASQHKAIIKTAEAICSGQIVAVKGIGGFHLVVDARNEAAVAELRKRKRREEKPLALMAPSVDWIKQICQVSLMEENTLCSSAAPIVLLQKEKNPAIPVAASLSPGNPCLGVMLPYSPLHHILLKELGFGIVATSGNLTDEPICIDENEALNRLKDIADAFLIHNRPIKRNVDDSVLRIIMEQIFVLRRSRGYAPMPITLDEELPPLLAVGGHLKNTIAVSHGKNVFLSQHIGDLETNEAHETFLEITGSLQAMYEIKPGKIACDLHPGYLSTKYAEQSVIPKVKVQHHHAHVVSCMADNHLEGPVLGISWDGTGLGTDNTIWGGEFLLSTKSDFRRIAHFRSFPLLSGEQSIKKISRVAIGLLYEMMGEAVFSQTSLAPIRQHSQNELSLFNSMLTRKINSPAVCSAGRVFDAVAAILDIRQTVSFEGQGAIELENIINPGITDFYEFSILANGEPHLLDWEPVIRAILADINDAVPVPVISAKFHNALIESIVNIAKRVKQNTIVLTGGCFQNRYLLENSVRRLGEEGFCPYWHHQVPTNDGGIALGQIIIASGKE